MELGSRVLCPVTTLLTSTPTSSTPAFCHQQLPGDWLAHRTWSARGPVPFILLSLVVDPHSLTSTQLTPSHATFFPRLPEPLPCVVFLPPHWWLLRSLSSDLMRKSDHGPLRLRALQNPLFPSPSTACSLWPPLHPLSPGWSVNTWQAPTTFAPALLSAQKALALDNCHLRSLPSSLCASLPWS